MLLNAPRDVSVAVQKGRKRVATPPSGVCRLRVGVCKNKGSITTDPRLADAMVDVLAMGDNALRSVVFLGAPLGAAGSGGDGQLEGQQERHPRAEPLPAALRQ